MKAWILVLFFLLACFFGYGVLSQSNGNNQASIEAGSLKVSVGRNIDPNGNPPTGNASKTYWTCYLNGLPLAPEVGIWWGRETKDAVWACNNWISECGNAQNGCQANKISQ